MRRAFRLVAGRWPGRGPGARGPWWSAGAKPLLGLKALTIGVDAWETRNLGIYLHWGYDTFVMAEEEDGDLVLYYAKKL